jgi:ubiquinone biosynthesis protein COQ9
MRPGAALSDLRLQLAPAIADAALFDGWSEAAVDGAADRAGVDRALARLAFRGAGEGAVPNPAMAMISAWIASIDAAMAAEFAGGALLALPVRERIRRLVEFRIDRVAGREEALRRALAVMASPRNLAAAARLGWASADAMWRLAGDTAADYNHYTKRAILGGVYAATLAVLVDDKSEGRAETRAFLGRRIDGIIRFEKAKARMLPADDRRFSVTRFLGRLRYPAR